MKISNKIIEGLFIEECKNRFLCKVLIKDKIHECYIPSASRLENYLSLRNKQILLTKVAKKNSRTKYSVYAVKYYNKYIFLNLLIVNNLLEEHLKLNIKKGIIYNEKVINKYKADFVVADDENLVVEAKGIISCRSKVLFPTVYSERAVRQLKDILELLKRGWKANYYIISLSPIVKEITINKSKKFNDYYKYLYECINLGMKLEGYSVTYENYDEIKLGKSIKIII